MPDMLLVSGESLVRNLALGHRIARGFGARDAASATCPTPSATSRRCRRSSRGFGLDSAILWRGFGGPRAEYLWEAPDGTRVMLLHLPREGYCNALRAASRPPARWSAPAARSRAIEASARGPAWTACC